MVYGNERLHSVFENIATRLQVKPTCTSVLVIIQQVFETEACDVVYRTENKHWMIQPIFRWLEI